MKRKRRRKTIRRNLLLLTLLVSLFALLAVAVHLLNTAPPVILPQGREEIEANRASPENAYVVLIEGEKLIPSAPDPLILKEAENPARSQFFEPELDSVARLVNVRRPDDDPDFLAYLHNCEPAFEKAREALEKPFCYQPTAATYLRPGPHATFDALLVRMIALGAALGRVEGAPEKGLPYLCDAMRLARRIAEDGNNLRSAVYLEALALKQIRLMARAGLAPADLETVYAALTALGPPFAERNRILEEAWRMLDNTLLLPVSKDERRELPEQFFLRILMWRLRHISRSIIKTRAQWYDLITLSPYEAERWMEAHRDLAGDRRRPFAPYHVIHDLLGQVAQGQAAHWSTVLAVALERYQREHGEYPETLDGLVPGWLPALPPDPFTNMPLVYRREAASYVLYSAGLDGEDDGGNYKAQRSTRGGFRRSRQQTDVILLSPRHP